MKNCSSAAEISLITLRAAAGEAEMAKSTTFRSIVVGALPAKAPRGGAAFDAAGVFTSRGTR